jgi:hypothetical protein
LETIVVEKVDDILTTFRSVAAVFEKRFEDLKSSRRRQLVVLVDHVWLDRLDPLAEEGHWNALLGMLILAFPTIRWVFGVTLHEKPETNSLTEKLTSELERIKKFHSLESLTHPMWDPVFDGSGLRNFVRLLTVRSAEKAGQLPVVMPVRPQLAIAIDEESSYCNFNALAAYRNGYRCFNIQTEELAASLLGKGAKLDLGPLRLTLEDMHLNFPDRTKNRIGDISLSDLYMREEYLPKLGKLGDPEGPKRIFVTTGRHRSDGNEKWEKNKGYRDRLHEEGRGGDIVNKPVSGIFRLWSKAKLEKAEGFLWPFQDDTHHEDEQSNEGHSARGRLLEIAIALLSRACHLINNIHSTSHAVVGAVLTTDALELLGGKTPTTSLEALALKHQFEVLAEVHFYGVGTKLEVEGRMKDIRSEIKSLSVHFDSETKRYFRKMSVMNAEAAILGDIIKIFREHNQFDEEQLIQNRARRLHFDLQLAEKWWGVRFLGRPVAKYLCFLLSSIWGFLMGTTLCIALLGGLFALTEIMPDSQLKGSVTANGKIFAMGDAEKSFHDVHADYDSSTGKILFQLEPQVDQKVIIPRGAFMLLLIVNHDEKTEALISMSSRVSQLCLRGLQHALTSFVSVGAPFSEATQDEEHHHRSAFYWLSCISMCCGFIHLGIFISHLYSLMSRR